MKKITTALILTLLLLVLPFPILAQKDQNTTNIVLAKGETVNKDYFAAGNSVSLEGTVNGDAYVAGGNILVDGTVNGDLIVAGGNIGIKGAVTGNIRAAGGNINIGGTVGRNATLLGGSINLSPNADIRGSLVSAGGNLTVLAPVGKEANLAGGEVILGNKINGDVNAAVEHLNLNSSAVINGNLTYLSRNTVTVAKEATVSGKTTQNVPQGRQPQEKTEKEASALFGFFRITNLILVAIIGFLLLTFLPVYFDRTSRLIIQKPWISLGIGFLAVVIFPIAFVLLLVTIIGIPLAFILIFALAIIMYLAKIFVVYVIGELILKQFGKQNHRIWALLVGLIIYAIFTSIPILGSVISAIVGLLGLGAILIEEKNFYNDLRSKQVI